MDSAGAGMEWWIGLAGWVLQDGNYPDFVAGERRRFALEFHHAPHHRLRVASAGTARRRHLGRGARYAVTAELLRADPFVLDFGLRAYRERMVLDDLRPPAAGTWLDGEIGLSVDPFFYKDELAHRPGVPALTYTWRVEEIQVETSPTIEVSYGHPLYAGPDEGPHRVSDPSRESWRTIDRTRMWDDERGSYRLRCVLEDVPATTPGNG